MKTKYQKWMDAFMESWKNLEGVKTTELFSKDVKYYETPMAQPCGSWSDVEALWAIVPNNQKNISYTYNIACCDKNTCFVNWQMVRTINDKKQKIDGVFQISLNDDNKLIFFKQWRYVE